MATMKDVVIDCAQPASLARFWAALLEHQPPPGDDLIALADPEGNELCLVQRAR